MSQSGVRHIELSWFPLCYWQCLLIVLGRTGNRHPWIRTTAMQTRNVNLTDELDRFVTKEVTTGRYENTREVARRVAALGARRAEV